MYPSNQGDWILGNVQQYGFYRVNYDTDNWRALMTQLKQQHTVCRQQLYAWYYLSLSSLVWRHWSFLAPIFKYIYFSQVYTMLFIHFYQKRTNRMFHNSLRFEIRGERFSQNLVLQYDIPTILIYILPVSSLESAYYHCLHAQQYFPLCPCRGFPCSTGHS